MEVWKEIPGYEGKYQASTEGRIKSMSRLVAGKSRTGTVFSRRVPERILKAARYCKAGHLSVVLGHGENGIPVHRLIARTFLGECPLGFEVLHINGDPTDNRVLNLRYDTRTQNILDVYLQGKAWRKLTIEDVHAIRCGLAAGLTGRKLAQLYGVSEQTISQIKRGGSFAWLPKDFTF